MFAGRGSSGGGVSLEEPPHAEHNTEQTKKRAAVDMGAIDSTLRASDTFTRPKLVTSASMIGWLRGRVIAEEPDGKLLVDVNGVGYELAVPAGTLGRGTERDGARDFFVHTHVREDALELFGFVNDRDRSAFRLLIAIPNVGPKTALGVLSSLSVSELSRAVAAGDAARLSKVPGIGKRTSERLLLELKGKLDDLDEGSIPVTKPAGMRARLVSALTNMGYRPSEAEKAVSSLGQRVDSEPLGDLIKLALAELR